MSREMRGQAAVPNDTELVITSSKTQDMVSVTLPELVGFNLDFL